MADRASFVASSYANPVAEAGRGNDPESGLVAKPWLVRPRPARAG